MAEIKRHNVAAVIFCDVIYSIHACRLLTSCLCLFEACSPTIAHCRYCSGTAGCWEQQCEDGYGIDMRETDMFCYSMFLFAVLFIIKVGVCTK